MFIYIYINCTQASFLMSLLLSPGENCWKRERERKCNCATSFMSVCVGVCVCVSVLMFVCVLMCVCVSVHVCVCVIMRG